MANYIKCPQDYFGEVNNKKIFLAGGISQCYDWQEDAADYLMLHLAGYDVDILNPRRDNFNVDTSEEEQVAWEYNAIQLSDYLLFWFPKTSVCPITLFELGQALGYRTKFRRTVAIGMDEAYIKRENILAQLHMYHGEKQDVPSDLFSLLNIVVKRVKEDLQ